MILFRQTAVAADKRTGMTLGELHEFCRVTLSQDPSPDVEVRVVVNLRGGIKEISTKGR